MARKVCEKCKRQMQDTNFYTYKNGQKFELCKSCLTMHIDNFDESTFLWILEKADVPYVPQEWNILRDKAYAKNPQKMNGMSVIGKYFSKMKLKQWKIYSWADSAECQQKRRKQDALKAQQREAEQAQALAQLQKGEISQAQYRTLVRTEYQKAHQYAVAPSTPSVPQNPIGDDNPFNEENFIPQEDLPNPADDLTKEDKQYLAMKWGRTYKPNDWIQLQKKYTQMMNSFDIQDADSQTALIFICKTYLKMNQAIDCGDLEGYQKLSRVYNDLRKSAKFTAAQNKEEKSDYIDSVGQLVAFCEKEGHRIPRYKIETPYDIIDKIIDDMKGYTKELIYSDSSLAKEIEDYIKEYKAIISRKKDLADAKEKGLQTPEITEQDTLDFKEFIKKEKQDTDLVMKGESQ